MVSLDITITLPDELAIEAQARGLLTSESLQQLIDAELARQRKVDVLFPLLERLPDADKGDLAEADVADEIRTYRAEKRAAREGHR